MAIKRSSQGGTPFGTTANRPANPAVGQTYYNGTLGYLEIYTSAGWAAAAKGIAFGNTANRPASPDLGTPYFNGQEARLELYTSNGWQNIVQETPSVVSIVGQLNESATSTLTINGTNFATGAIAYVVGTNGVETVANTTTLVSVVEITAVFPALPPANGPYDVKIVNTSNLYGVLYETLGVNDNPVWSTSSGSLGTFTELDVVSVTVAATDATDSTNSTLQYSLVSGALPTGFSLNSTTGVISGTALNVVSNTTYSFTIGASDSRNTVQTRAFSITINDRNPVWVTSSALPIFTKNIAYSTSVSATEDESGAITYSLVSGSLPTGLTLSSSGIISGTPTSSINTSFTIRATVTASGNTIDREFTMANFALVWSTTSPLPTFTKNVAYSTTVVATDDGTASYSILSGTLPVGLSLNSSTGIISGTPTSSANASFTIRATDNAGNIADRAFTMPNVTPTWVTSSGALTPALVGSAYSNTVSATDDGTISYSLFSGSLPAGLSLSSSGTISGTPTVWSNGTSSSFTIRVTDDSGNTADRAFTLYASQTTTVTLTSTGTWTAPSNLISISEVLLVGAGGGGGATAGYSGGTGGGGGGAGGVKLKTNISASPNTGYTHTIGGGGTASASSTGGQPGGNTTMFGVTAYGGNGGANAGWSSGVSQNPAGSGGGGSNYTTGAVDSGVNSGVSNADGQLANNGANSGSPGGGGGGGATSAASGITGGSGYTFYSTVYAGGGGGTPGGSGGSGIGGNGSTHNSGNSTSGAVNRGGGGGGASSSSMVAGSPGGSGVIVIRYLS